MQISDVQHYIRNQIWDINTLAWVVQTASAASGGGLTDSELRASPVPVQATIDTTGLATSGGQTTGNASLASIDTKLANPLPVSLASVPSHAVTNAGTFAVQVTSVPTTAVTGTFWQATQPVSGTVTASGPLTDTQLRASAVPVSGTFFQATQPVSGTVTASGPLTDTQLRASAVPVSGTVTANQGGTWTVQPGNTANTTAWKVDGSAVTQPVSGTVTANVGTSGSLNLEATQTAMSAKLPASLGQKTMAASMAIVIASDQGAISTQKAPTGGTNVLKTGTITTTATTADQVVLTYTVTAAKTLYLQYVIMYGRLTVPAATATVLGAISLETPSGTKVMTFDDMNPTTSELEFNPMPFPEPIPVAAGVVVRVVVTPAAVTSMLWRANFGGYEK